MSINRTTVEHIALLGRLDLSEEEKERYGRQLSAILDYVGQLNRLDLAAVEPLVHPLDLTNVFRGDEPAASLSRTDVLSNAPDREEPFFKVPRVIEAE